MRRSRSVLPLAVAAILAATLAAPAGAAPPVPVSFTILHTNDFHGNLEQFSGGSTSNPGMARVSQVVNGVRTAVGADNVLLVDAGDEMQGSLLSNLQKGVPTIDVFNAMGYDVATFGNHEFDWGQTVLGGRMTQADYPYVSANIVSGTCAESNWTPSPFGPPYVVQDVGVAPNTVKVGFIGVTSTETPSITLASATEGLCFKDPATSIIHYYDELAAQADVIVVLSHLGFNDGGYGYGIPVYGDQTLAQKLIDAGKPANLIIGGHSHTDVAVPPPVVGGKTTVVQARYNGRQVGRADLTVGTDGSVGVSWSKLDVSPTGTADPAIEALIAEYVNDPAYQQLINTEIGWTDVPIARDYNGNGLMGQFVNDAIYDDLNGDAEPANDVDIVFNNPGGLRADIACAEYPCKLTYGMLFSVLPFGNQTVVGSMTGERILELLGQSASLNKGALQVAGIRYSFWNYQGGTPAKAWAWGAFDPCVIDRTDGTCDPLDLAKTYRIATNEFLAPAGQDNFYAFKYVTDISYWGDMLDGVNRWVSETYTEASPYAGTPDGRITRDGDATGGSIVPITVLHHNDSHGNLAKGSYPGYTQLATLINQERSYNPDRTVLLSSGDNIQGDAMMYFFKSAPLGYAADGTPLDPPLTTHPMMAVMNAMGYDAWTLGNHEFNFGKDIFGAVLSQAEFPTLQANVMDDGSYGLADVPVEPYVEQAVGPEGIKLAILGIGNHRVPNYELPSNIPGLTFTDPIEKTEELVAALGPTSDIVLALTHIGFTENPASVEVDKNVDTNLAATVAGIDAIVGGHSHTNPANPGLGYKYLPTIEGGPDGAPVVIGHAYRYNNTLGELFLGMRTTFDALVAGVDGAYAAGDIDNAGIYASLMDKVSDIGDLLEAGKTKAATNVLNAFVKSVKAQSGKHITAEAAAMLMAAANEVITRPDGYAVASRAGQYLAVTSSTVEDPAIKAIVDPYAAAFATYNGTVIGQTTAPIDALQAYTQETNGANLQADAAIHELESNGIAVDFHLSGAMSNRAVAAGATPTTPVTLKVSDMFTLMPYENSLVVMEMNGPQLEAVLERAYRNYFYYKYVPGYGGYSYYTTCMIDTDAGNVITYDDSETTEYDPNVDHVISLVIDGVPVDFADATTTYRVSTVNYLAAGSCNFNDDGVTLWPLDQIVNDTQYYVRDAVIDYIEAMGTVSPAIEGRLVFVP